MKENFYPPWNHRSHCRRNCVRDHSSVQTVKIMNSSDLTAAKFLIYLFISVDLLLLSRCMDLKKGILFKKIRNHSQPWKLKQNIKDFHKFTQ